MSHRCRLIHFKFGMEWEEREEWIFNAEDLFRRIDEIDDAHIPIEGEGPSVILINDHHDRMHIGLAGSQWVLLYSGHDGVLLESLGDVNVTGEQAFQMPEWTEIPSRCLIPIDRAKTAVRTWFETGFAGDPVHWIDRL